MSDSIRIIFLIGMAVLGVASLFLRRHIVEWKARQSTHHSMVSPLRQKWPSKWARIKTKYNTLDARLARWWKRQKRRYLVRLIRVAKFLRPKRAKLVAGTPQVTTSHAALALAIRKKIRRVLWSFVILALILVSLTYRLTAGIKFSWLSVLEWIGIPLLILGLIVLGWKKCGSSGWSTAFGIAGVTAAGLLIYFFVIQPGERRNWTFWQEHNMHPRLVQYSTPIRQLVLRDISRDTVTVTPGQPVEITFDEPFYKMGLSMHISSVDVSDPSPYLLTAGGQSYRQHPGGNDVIPGASDYVLESLNGKSRTLIITSFDPKAKKKA